MQLGREGRLSLPSRSHSNQVAFYVGKGGVGWASSSLWSAAILSNCPVPAHVQFVTHPIQHPAASHSQQAAKRQAPARAAPLLPSPLTLQPLFTPNKHKAPKPPTPKPSSHASAKKHPPTGSASLLSPL